MNFGLQDPYHVLVDGTFIMHALKHRIHIKEQLPKMLGARATPCATSCTMAELRSLGDRASGAAIIAKGYYRVKCGHEDNPINAAQCLCQQISNGNERNFMIATNDTDLVWKLRNRPGIPLLRLNGQVPSLEEPSTKSRIVKKAADDEKISLPDWEKPKLKELAKKEEAAKAAALIPRKRKGPKGANPLSCRKKKKELPEAKKNN